MAGGERLDEFKKQLSNFVKALIALAPSRNYVTQFLYIIKLNGSIDYRILEDAYPEIVKNEYVRECFAKAFGILFKDKVSLENIWRYHENQRHLHQKDLNSIPNRQQ